MPTEIITNVWQSTACFFDLSIEKKMQFVKPQHEYPFGYSPLGAESLSKGKSAENNKIGEISQANSAPADLKELFSLGPDDPATLFPQRIFPSEPEDFESSWTIYYSALNVLANQILQAFSLSLGLEEDFFQKYVVSAVYFPGATPRMEDE